MPRTLVEELNDLHAAYVALINLAIEQDDFARAEELAAAYDDDAIQLMAEREGKTHLLPIRRGPSPDTTLRRLVKGLRPTRAA